MSDNKKYYYLKLKDTFFDSEEMKVIESMPNGAVYQNVYLKMCLLSLKSEGALTFKDIMPYDIQMLSTVLRQNIDTVKTAVELFVKLGLVSITDTETMYMTDIQSLIGRSSTEADRVKAYRERIKDNETPQIECTESVQMYENCTPEIEIEKEIELKKDIETEKETDSASSSLSDEKVFAELFPDHSSKTNSSSGRVNFKAKKTNEFLNNYFSKILPENKTIAEEMTSLIENQIKQVQPKFHFAPNKNGNEMYTFLEFSRKNGVEMKDLKNTLSLALKENTWWKDKITSADYFCHNYPKIALRFASQVAQPIKRSTGDVDSSKQNMDEVFK